jgi:hypothetical protein
LHFNRPPWAFSRRLWSSDLVAAAQSANRTGLLSSDRYKNSGTCVGLSRNLYIDR